VRAPLVLLVLAACGNQAGVSDPQLGLGNGPPATGGVGGAAATGGNAADATGGDAMMTETGGTAGMGAVGGTSVINVDDGTTDPAKECPPTTCAEQGVGCGKLIDKCGNVTDCATEGLTCGFLEVCTGTADMPASCQIAGDAPCDLCHAVPDCSAMAQGTKLVGRVITPGRDDANAANQLGVPNAFVYIPRNKGVGDLPAIASGIPAGGTSCDRCDEQDLGPVLASGNTDATGAFTLEGNIPVGEEFTLVIKAGRFRRGIAYTLPASAACQTTMLPTTLPDNPTRLPRSMDDGLAVNIPRIAVTTGEVDAMECVLEKMGVAHQEFGNPGADGSATPRVHLYVGGPNGGTPVGHGARIDSATPHASTLYGDETRITSYDIVLSDCEGGDYDSQGSDRNAQGPNVVNYVNRGGRFFASHLSFTWLDRNGTAVYDAANPEATGLAPAATWNATADGQSNTGTGNIALTRPQASPRIQSFADWMASEQVTMPPAQTFNIIQPRSQAAGLGPATEEFVYTSDVTKAVMGVDTTTADDRTQQFSFNTPYAAPDDAVCGRVAYSGFHVSASSSDPNTSPFASVTFPDHCTGDLSPQEKVLLYMLFDLNACVGMTPPPPACTPATCDSLMLKCGFSGDTCGGVLDCGPCPLPTQK